jgi:hypothetical protein
MSVIGPHAMTASSRRSDTDDSISTLPWRPGVEVRTP